jgi:ATP phosphoribosyltransferase regulatory subunit
MGHQALKLHITAIPQGTRTFLFDEAELKRRIEQEIFDKLKEGGFQEIITPLLEYYDSASTGMGEEANRIIRFAEEDSGMAIALRPDITSQVARSAATHLGKAALPLKLCYNGPVFRRARKGKGEQYVINQSGMEIIGKPGPDADAEVILSIISCMDSVKLKTYNFSLGHAGIISPFIKRLKPPYPEKIRGAILKKDKAAIAEILSQNGHPKELSGAITRLAGLCGDISVLKEAKDACKGDEAALSAIGNLEQIIKSVGSAEFESKLVIDLGETRGWGYYTGIIIELFSGTMLALGAGGRYDNLVGRYGREIPAVGFAFDVDKMMEAATREKIGDK